MKDGQVKWLIRDHQGFGLLAWYVTWKSQPTRVVDMLTFPKLKNKFILSHTEATVQWVLRSLVLLLSWDLSGSPASLLKIAWRCWKL